MSPQVETSLSATEASPDGVARGAASRTLAGLRERADELIALARQRGAQRIWVFGSVARGAPEPANDVDLLVEFAPGTSLLDHGELLADLSDALGCRVDLVSLAGLRGRARERILAEAVAL